jgi:3-hydroxyisobutyrate dehydrogenase
MEIAFIGLGNMGSGMAANLVRAGHAVTAYDLSETRLEQAKTDGCFVAESLGAAVEGAQVVITMLPSSNEVRHVYAEVISHAHAGALMIDCSTIDVEGARAVAQAAQTAGFSMVDAPVSGGVAAAVAGTLTFMVGGTDAGFKAAQPILAAMGKAVIHAGHNGAGQAAKICNNMLLAISMIGTCEAFALAEKLGLEAQTFFDIASKASGQTWAMTHYCPVAGPVSSSPANRGYEGGFAAALMLKDLNLAMQAVGQTGADAPLGAKSHALYEALVASGHGFSDFSIMMERIRRGA